MPEMTDPMNALIQLQLAIDNSSVRFERGTLHPDIFVIADEPLGTPRLTYAIQQQGTVVAVAIFALTAPIEGIPCFQIGYAVIESMRRQGLGAEIIGKGTEELRNGFAKHQRGTLYIEAIVATSNEPSNKLAQRLVSSHPVSCTDSASGCAAYQYTKLLQL